MAKEVSDNERLFIQEFKILCDKYGYSDKIRLNTVIQDYEIRLRIKIKRDVEGKKFVDYGVSTSNDNIRQTIKAVGKIERVIPVDKPEDEYEVLHCTFNISRLEEKAELVNRDVDKVKMKKKVNEFDEVKYEFTYPQLSDNPYEDIIK